MTHSQWIECKKGSVPANEPINPWANREYSPRPNSFERQFLPIDNMGGLPMFRKSFAAKKGDKVTLTATSLGIYVLWCNGKRVGIKGDDGEMIYDEFNPGWTVYTHRVMATAYDISDYIADGENVILATVAPGWWMGRIIYNSYGDKCRMAFCAELDINGEKQGTDTSWQTKWGGPIRAADLWDGEIYDASLPSYEEIAAPGYDISDWSAAVNGNDQVISALPAPHFPEKNTPVTELDVVPFIGPAVRIRKHLTRKPKTVTVYDGIVENGSDYGEIHITNTFENTDSFILKAGEKAVIDFGQEVVGFPQACFKTKKGAYIQIRVAEMLNDSGLISRGNDNPKGSVYTINYRSAKAKAYYIAEGKESGEIYCPMFSFFGFRYLEFEATEDIAISELCALVVGSDIEEVGHIETSHKDVNKLLSNIIWGQRSNYLSIPTDCPQRDERLGWTGDTQFFCNTAAYNANVLEFFRKWLADARDSQHPCGLYHDVIPMNRIIGGGGAAWADAPLIVAQVMWQMYGDKEIIRENIASFDTYMEWLASRDMVGPNPTYGDWLAYDLIDPKYISKAYYAWDALIMAELYKVLDNEERSASYAALYDRIRANFRETYMSADGDLLPEFRKQTGYLLALHIGAFNENEIAPAADALEQKIIENNYQLSTGFVGTAILCKTLAKYGKNNIAYSLLLQTEDPSWLYSIHQGATTIWERWNSYTLAKGFGEVSMNSFNHYSFGAVQEWMYRHMAGIEADQPAFAHIVLSPKPDLRSNDEIPAGQEKITWVKASYKSVAGLIRSEWSLADGKFIYTAETPVETTVCLPITGAVDHFKMNGEICKLADHKTENGCVVIKVGAGKYDFEI